MMCLVRFLLAGCVFTAGSTLPTSTDAQCFALGSWNGTDDSSCAQHNCHVQHNCTLNGKLGICCVTTCKGHNCFVNLTGIREKRSDECDPEWEECSQTDIVKRSSHTCPRQWNGSHCNQNMCPCQTGMMCCPTKCGKINCYKPGMGKRSVIAKRSSRNCPKDWNGSNCNQNKCTSRSNCDTGWLCCPTKCGKKNCYEP